MTQPSSRLYQKIAGCLWGGAVGDALGGPVEGWSHAQIVERYTSVERMLPYAREVGDHGPFTLHAGSYTDDTRLKHVLCETILATRRIPTRGDFARMIIHRQEHASSNLERGFLEEYALKAIYDGEKLIFAGEPTNGAIMMNSPIGIIHACDPDAAFETALALAFLTDGYARHSAAMMAAAIAAAFKPGVTVDSIVDDMLAAMRRHRDAVEGEHWRGTSWRYAPNERAVETAVAMARETCDMSQLTARYYDVLQRGPLFSEAAQTLAVAIGVFVAADGDPRPAIVGAVNYGRDNDSYASVAGALAGAYYGIDALPCEWVEAVRAANPTPDIDAHAEGLTQFVMERFDAQKKVVGDLAALLV